MKPLSKAILFCRVTHERKTHLYPVAVFANAQAARQYAVFLSLAHQHGDAETAKKLDPRTILDSEGKLAKGAKWAAQTVAYAPVPDAGVPESFDMDEPATA